MENYIISLNQSIKKLVFNSLKITHMNIRLIRFLIRAVMTQNKSVKIRKQWEEQGVHVPPFMIASITSKCNLRCKGCYANVHNRNCKQELTDEKWDSIFNESQELGISFILLAGGEPFIRYKLIESAGQYKKIIFPIFTNGTLINQETVKLLKKHRNIVPIISIEGKDEQTDERRGLGISEKTMNAMTILKKHKIFFGLSFTVNKNNFDVLVDHQFIKNHYHKGCKVFFYVEYVPIEKGSEDIVITQEQRELLDVKLNELRNKFKALFIAFPGDEKEYGGCLSSGRGFVHISAEGNLEPCPFAPYSDTNLNEISLKEALNSEFLKKIRESDEHLSETEHGCALFNKQEWVQSLLNK